MLPGRLLLGRRGLRLFVAGLLTAGSAPGFSSAPAMAPPPEIVGVGSSTIARMPRHFRDMAEQFGTTYVNMGDGGARVESLAARMGAIPLRLVVTGGKVPPIGEVPVTAVNMPVDKAMDPFPVTLNGVGGTIAVSRSGPHNSPRLIFTRTVAGPAVGVRPGTSAVPTATRLRSALWIINAGKNNMSTTPAEVITRYVGAMASWASPHARQVLVVGNFVDADGADSRKIKAVNEIWREQYGRQFFDLQGYLMSEAVWTDTGLDPTDQDRAAALKGVLAPSLSRDGHHLNTQVAKAVSDRIRDIIARLGWLPLPADRGGRLQP